MEDQCKLIKYFAGCTVESFDFVVAQFSGN